MGNTIKNVILVLALSAVAIMCIGLFLYDYIPSGLTVSKANQYETASTTTEALSSAQEAQKLLTDQSQSTTSTSGSTTPVKTNIVLKEYDVSKSDLEMYHRSGSYVSGRPDPFAEVKVEDTNTTGTTSSGTGNSTSNGTTTKPSDGTFYNTAHQK